MYLLKSDSFMTIDIESVKTLPGFKVSEGVVNGENVFLITPNEFFINWNQTNKIFRSSLWNKDGQLISAGFPKFTNWGENEKNFPVPKKIAGCNIVEKIDGSLLIVSKYKGQYILRTRGTIDAHLLSNGKELEIFETEILPKLPDSKEDQWNHSYLFEWVSIQNVIVIKPEQTQWIYIGKVYHHDYSLESQQKLNEFAEQIGLQRPNQYTFPEFEDLIKNVSKWERKEGVVVYSDSDQALHKVKSEWYLICHAMKTELNTQDKVIDLWFSCGMPSYQEFEKIISEQFDWELWKQIQGTASKILDANKKVNEILEGMKRFTEKIKSLPTRKAQAEKILESYGSTNRASFVFTILDNRPIDNKMRKKLLYQVLN